MEFAPQWRHWPSFGLPGGWRISLEFDPQGAHAANLRCALTGPAGPLAETWLYRWVG